MRTEDAIILPINERIINKTLINTVKKYNYTVKGLMYGRTPVELLDNIFMGDFAKNCVFDYLVKHTDVKLVDYDEVRTDNFESHDPGWDIMIGDKKIKVEVKSSIPPNQESIQSIIDKRDIKITASHDNGHTWIQPEEIESDIHVQVYFYAKSYKRGYDDFQSLYRVIANDPSKIIEIINASKYYKPYFLGWNTKTNIIKFSKELSPNTWTFSWTSRIYWRCPIKVSYNMNQLISFIESQRSNDGSKSSNKESNTKHDSSKYSNVRPPKDEGPNRVINQLLEYGKTGNSTQRLIGSIPIKEFQVPEVPKLEIPNLEEKYKYYYEFEKKNKGCSAFVLLYLIAVIISAFLFI